MEKLPTLTGLPSSYYQDVKLERRERAINRMVAWMVTHPGDKIVWISPDSESARKMFAEAKRRVLDAFPPESSAG